MKIAIIAALLGLSASTGAYAETSVTKILSEGSNADTFEGSVVDSSSAVLAGFSARDAFGFVTSNLPHEESMVGGHVIFDDMPRAFINFHTASAVTIDAVDLYLQSDAIDNAFRGFNSVSLYASQDGGETFGTLLAHAGYDPASGPVHIRSTFEATTAQYFRFEGVMPHGGARILEIDAQSAVPEPATWAMMIAGFGAVGGSLRYRRRRTAVQFA